MMKLIVLAILGILAGCNQQSASSGLDKFARCNNKSANLSEYARCRCLQITGAKSATKEMDDCETNPNVYAEGYKGEISEDIRKFMK